MQNAHEWIRTTRGLVCGLLTLVALGAGLSACGAGGASSAKTSSTATSAPLVEATTASNSVATKPCGAWSNADGSTGQAVAVKYGSIRNCALVGDSWILSTVGLTNQPGVIGVDSCHGDAACLNPQTDRSISAWTFYPAPNVGHVAILGMASPGVLLVDNGGHRLNFTISTGTYQQ
ncbi:MAG TPA: hypothetical protein VF792_10525 [Ktedonobacterales bacterium]